MSEQKSRDSDVECARIIEVKELKRPEKPIIKQWQPVKGNVALDLLVFISTAAFTGKAVLEFSSD